MKRCPYFDPKPFDPKPFYLFFFLAPESLTMFCRSILDAGRSRFLHQPGPTTSLLRQRMGQHRGETLGCFEEKK